MEASSARFAARDRFGMIGDPGPSPLQRYIQQACSPDNFESNLALNLEISDLINQKKGNAPREAAVAIVNFVNHRNPNVALLALSLLDICVKNCGYPFHLQIGTKEFLNELVRRFPERPPIRPTRVQHKILEAIEEWRGTICQTSRYKEDLGYIRDMHRLLSYKGYMFPEVRREDAAVLNPSDNLKSAEEMEEEERAAQSAKLQELIRRGGPEDLQEANRLMKIMAGYDTRHKTDYRAKAAEEVGKIQQKARLLEERLQNFKLGDMMEEGDVFEELASALQSAQPKIQKMCEEESEDYEAVSKLLEINDSIHRTVERYKLMKKGDVEGASKIAQGTLGTSTGVTKNAENELSLINLDGDGETDDGLSANVTNQEAGGLENDLLGLSIGSPSYGQGGISLGGTTNVPRSTLMPSASQHGVMRAPTPTESPAPSRANYSAFSGLGVSLPVQKTSPVQVSSSIAQPAPVKPAEPVLDAFASLSNPLRQPVSQPNASQLSSSASLLELAQIPLSTNASATDDEEWSFSSALPERSDLPSTYDLVIIESSVHATLHVVRQSSSDPTITLVVKFSSRERQYINELKFQVAVSKAFSLKMKPQSGQRLKPHEREGVSQVIILDGVEYGKGATVKMRWKVSYKIGTESVHEQGEISSLGVP